MPYSSEMQKRLDNFYNNGETVVIQVKDLEPKARNVNQPDKILTGILTKSFSDYYNFREHGIESSREIIIGREHNIKSLKEYNNAQANREGGRRRTHRTRRVKRKGTKAKKSRR